MTFNEFISKWSGKGADFDGSYGNQCVDLARFYWKEVCEISQPKAVAGAKDFWTNFESDLNLKNNFTKITNSPTGVPQRGDVIIWGSSYGPYGHIAIFTTGNVDNFKAFSQNDPIGTLSNERGYKNYSGVLGWFRPNKAVNDGSNNSGEDNMLLTYLGVQSEDEAKAKLKEHLGEKDNKCDWGNSDDSRGGFLGSARREINDLKGKNTALTNEVESQKEQIRVLNDELENCSEVEADYSIPSITSYGDNGLQIKKKISETETMTINYERK